MRGCIRLVVSHWIPEPGRGALRAVGAAVLAGRFLKRKTDA